MTLHTILEELVSGKYNHTDQRVKERKLIQAEQKIKELMLGEEEIKEILQLELCNGTRDCENEPECPTDDGCQPMDLAVAIHSVMLKKLEE